MSFYYGKYKGRVISNKDKENSGRLLIECTEVLGSFQLWALPCFLPNVISIPDAGDIVWIEFEGGNKQFPIWTGCLYTANKIKTILGDTPLSANNIVVSKPKTLCTGNAKTKEAYVGLKKVALHGDEVNTTITHTTGVVNGTTVVTSVSPSKGTIDTKR